jgi:hypothetical protein
MELHFPLHLLLPSLFNCLRAWLKRPIKNKGYARAYAETYKEYATTHIAHAEFSVILFAEQKDMPENSAPPTRAKDE